MDVNIYVRYTATLHSDDEEAIISGKKTLDDIDYDYYIEEFIDKEKNGIEFV